MANHFEIDGDGFDSLLDSDEPVDNSTEVETETVEIEEPVTESVEETNDSEHTNSSEPNNGDEEDFLMSFLNEYGIKDGKVSYENDDGTTEEVNFNDLDSTEKLNILKEITSPNLSKDEVATINYLRSNNATIKDVIEYYSQKAVEDYIKENGPVEKNYSIDEYTDDELYVADLKSKFSDMSEEDLKADLEAAKNNEALFKKKVDTIRKQYKDKEDQLAKERVAEKEKEFNDFSNSLKNQLLDFNEISMDYKDSKSDSLQIENHEKEEIYNYILDRDENGTTKFFRDLNDPKRLVELAWFALYGKDAISDITNYWKTQLKSTRRNQDKDTKSQTTVVTRKDNKQQKDTFINHRNYVETDYGDDLL